MKLSLVMPTSSRKSVCAVSLYAISALQDLKNVEVIVGDYADIPLYCDEACRAALDCINLRSRLHYIRGAASGPSVNRLQLYEMAMERSDAFLALDQDCVLPENFLIESQNNFTAAGDGWGYIGHYSVDVLNPNREAEVIRGARPLSGHQDSWIGQEDYNERLRTSFSSCGVAIWFRTEALREVFSDIAEMARFYNVAEDGFTCMPLSSQFPCFAAKMPWVTHYRSREQSRDYKDTSLVEQRTVFAELDRRGLMSAKVRKFFLGEMRFCGFKGNGTGFTK